MNYYEALTKCVNRYQTMITHRAQWNQSVNWEDLFTFTTELKQGIIDRLPLNKLNRWLGYIQGVLIERGATTVETERDWTRKLFRPLDFPEPDTRQYTNPDGSLSDRWGEEFR